MMRLRYALMLAAIYSQNALAVTMTQEQLRELVDDFRFIYGVWSTFSLFLIVSGATMLWRRISKNEDTTKVDIQAAEDRCTKEMTDKHVDMRHRIEGIHSNQITLTTHMLEAIARLEQQSASVSGQTNDVLKITSDLRERIKTLEVMHDAEKGGEHR